MFIARSGSGRQGGRALEVGMAAGPGQKRMSARRPRAAGLVVGLMLVLASACSVPPSPQERCQPDCPPPRLPHPLY